MKCECNEGIHMKARLKNTGKEEVCKDYPNCDCDAHLVIEMTNKTRGYGHISGN